MTDLPTDSNQEGAGFPVVVGGRGPLEGGDRAQRAKGLADAFAATFAPTLPLPGAEQVPGPGRHVRVSAETGGQLYVAGQTFMRDARARITVRASGMPTGWSVRLTLVDASLIALAPGTPASRANPAVLRAQRQMADPAAAAALAAPLRRAFAGRPIQSEMHSLFVPAGLVFLREASIALPLSERADDDVEMLRRLCEAARTAGPTADATAEAQAPPAPPPPARRGHLRIIQ